MSKFIPFVFSSLMFGLVSFASDEVSTSVTAAERESLSPKAFNDMTINYGSSSWNRRSTVVDTAYLYMRDAISGRLAKIILEETEPDSSIFRGKFSIRWEDLKSVRPEVYIPTRLQKTDSTPADFERLLKSGSVIKRPFVYSRDEKNKHVLEVFDTRSQASAALKAHRERIIAERRAKAVTTEQVLDKSQDEFAREAKKQAELLALQSDAANRETDRVRKEQIERQRQLERQRESQRLSAQDQARKKAQGRQVAAKALQLYTAGDFTGAEPLFKQATELDPENNAYYYQYGVTLYRLERFDEAVVKLNMAKVSGTEDLEKNYYLALIHYRLKEINQAIEKLQKVKAAKHPAISPSASFYLGMVLFSTEEFEKAKSEFEYVLDESQDPALDQRAEDMIEKSMQMIAYKKDMAKRHVVGLTFGVTYDSNVLYQPDSATSSALDSAGARFLGSYNYEYRVFKREASEFGIKSTGNMIYSFSDNLSTADPYVLNIMPSYARKGTWNGKVFKYSLEPGYEILHMNIDGTGEIENILNSIILNNAFMLVSEGRIGIYNFDLRSDTSPTEATSEDENSDSVRVNIKTTQLLFQDKQMKKAIILGGGVTYNEAVGKNKDYLKVDLMALYTAPLTNWLSSWNAGLSVYYQDYSNADTARTDQNYSLMGGLGKTWNEQTSSAFSFLYNTNQSNDENSQYNKYTLTLTTTHNF